MVFRLGVNNWGMYYISQNEIITGQIDQDSQIDF
ncbi:Uncharacterised protein [Streptococcus pneumoniae]|nr:Uncharacterised protein [Streptococcus pneumoniae]CVR93671.1 Uncharacterised protein [Streptococcus pneumoniae]